MWDLLWLRPDPLLFTGDKRFLQNASMRGRDITSLELAARFQH